MIVLTGEYIISLVQGNKQKLVRSFQKYSGKVQQLEYKDQTGIQPLKYHAT